MITSVRNPLVKRVRRLAQKKYRREEEAFFVEGIRPVLTAIERGAPLHTLIYAPELLTSEVAWAAIAEQQVQGVEAIMVSGDVFRKISNRDNPVGFGAIVQTRLRPLDGLAAGANDIFVALLEVADPGNLGAIVRTVDGVGATGLILIGQTADPFHTTAVRASMGALFTVPVVEAVTANAVWGWARTNGVQTVATSAQAGTTYWEADYHFPTLLLMGSEGEGLPPDVLRRAEMAVKIPMYGVSSSLNLAVATGLLLYEMRRRLL